MEALDEYERPEVAAVSMPAGALLADTAENLAVVTNWATRYPDVEFDLFFSPYSILYWDKIDRMGKRTRYSPRWSWPAKRCCPMRT